MKQVLGSNDVITEEAMFTDSWHSCMFDVISSDSVLNSFPWRTLSEQSLLHVTTCTFLAQGYYVCHLEPLRK